MLPRSSAKAKASELAKHLVDNIVDIRSIALVDLDVNALILATVRQVVVGNVYDLSEDIRCQVLALLLHVRIMVQIYEVWT